MLNLQTRIYSADSRKLGATNGAWIGAIGLLVIALVTLSAFWLGARVERPRSLPNQVEATAERPAVSAPASELEVVATASDRRDASTTNEPIDAGPALTIELSTLTSLMPDAKPVPRIDVELGLDTPAPPTPAALLRCTTDELGHAQLALPLATIRDARAKGIQRFWVRVATKGYQPRTTFKIFPDGMPSIAMKLIAFEGSSLKGRVFDADGNPTAAKVRAAPRKSDGSLGFGGGGDARSDGWFEIQLFKAGVLQVVADAGEHGTAVIRDLDVATASPSAEIELHASGPGVVRGHVRDSNDRPNAGVQLLVIVAELDDELGSLQLKEPRATDLELEGRGRTWVTLETDAQGAFEARGLRLDEYRVRATTEHAKYPEGYPLLLTRSSVRSDGTELALVLDRPHLAIHVENEDHTPWVGKCRGDPPVRGDPMSWPKQPIVVVERVRDEVQLGRFEERTLHGKRVKDGEFVFDIETERHYLVGLLGGTQAWEPVEVAVPANSGRIDVALVARESPHGTLVLSVFDGNGNTTRDGIVVKIEDVRRGTPIAIEDDLRERAWPVHFELPEGEYRVAVEGVAAFDRHHGTVQRSRAYGRLETIIRVVRDAETKLRADLPVGARLHLKLEGVEKPEDLKTLQDRHPTWSGLQYFSNLAELTLESDGHWPQPVNFQFEMEGSSAAGTHERSSLPIGSAGTSELVSSGRFRLVARMPGGRSASADVELVDGKTTDVTLHLD